MSQAERFVGVFCIVLITLVGAGFGYLLAHESLVWAGIGAVLYGSAMGYVVWSTRY